ncbi:integrase core domain-containing protein [Nocardioides pyridinolyticus]
MAADEPIDPRVGLAISQWPEDAPRGSVSTFCAEHGISRKSFYELRKRTMLEGPAAVLEPRSRRPASSPTKLSDEVKAQAIQVRAALEASGLGHGPISVHDKMKAMGLDVVPSVASLARIFREAGVARLEPRKRPRSAWRRFVYPAPNACWQLDAAEYVLTGGRKCVIFQLIDDQLNPSRRGLLGQLVDHVSRLGVEAITGKPYKPTTQGKNERFHQTLFRCLDKQPLAESIPELRAQVDAFDHIYNTQRPHQGLPGRVTPLTAWEATAKAEPPRPKAEQRPWFDRPMPTRYLPPQPPPPADLPPDTRVRKVSSVGAVHVDKVFYKIDVEHRFKQVLVIADGDKLTITDLNGEVLAEHTRPASGITYVGNGRRPGPRPKNLSASPMS